MLNRATLRTLLPDLEHGNARWLYNELVHTIEQSPNCIYVASLPQVGHTVHLHESTSSHILQLLNILQAAGIISYKMDDNYNAEKHLTMDNVYIRLAEESTIRRGV